MFFVLFPVGSMSLFGLAKIRVDTPLSYRQTIEHTSLHHFEAFYGGKSGYGGKYLGFGYWLYLEIECALKMTIWSSAICICKNEHVVSNTASLQLVVYFVTVIHINHFHVQKSYRSPVQLAKKISRVHYLISLT